MAFIEKYEGGETFRRGTDAKQLKLLKKGVKYWNDWIEEIEVSVNLYKADLSRRNLNGALLSNADLGMAKLDHADLSYARLYDAELENSSLVGVDLSDSKAKSACFRGANMSNANLFRAEVQRADFGRANLTKAKFTRAKLRGAGLQDANCAGANLTQCDLRNADLSGTNLQKAKLIDADLSEANLSGADLTGADLTGANLEKALFIETNLENATLTRCRIYGLSAWALKGTPKNQSSLIVTPEDQPEITADQIDVGQFIYLLINRSAIRNVIDSITSKGVLILGRFTPERKAVLDAIAEELRKYNLLPIIFDFERSASRDFTETIKTLAGLSMFVIADITNPSSAPLELQATVPDYQIPFIPIIQKGEKPFAMFKNLSGKYFWVFEPLAYTSMDSLRRGFKKIFIDRAFAMRKRLLRQKAKTAVVQTVEDFLR